MDLPQCVIAEISPAVVKALKSYPATLDGAHTAAADAADRYAKGQTADAAVLYAVVCTLFELLLGQDHPDILSSRNNMAFMYGKLGHVAEAIRLHELNLADRVRMLGPENPSTFVSRDNLALAYEEVGRMADAVRLHELNLAERLSVLGPEHPHTLVSRNHLASAYGELGRVAEAIRLYELNLVESLRIFGRNHADTLTSRNALAVAYGELGRVATAVRLHELNLAERLRVFGSNHPSTLVSRNNLAVAYMGVGRVADAVRLHKLTLAEQQSVLGPEHESTFVTRNDLAMAYRAIGRMAEAVRLHELNLAERLRVLGPDHRNTLGSRNNLAVAYEEIGRVADAIRLHELNLAQRLRVLGPDHPHTLINRNDLGAAYRAAGRMAEAIDLLAFNLGEYLRVLGPDHPSTLVSRNNLALTYRAAGRAFDAEVLLSDSLVAAERVRATGGDATGRATTARTLSLDRVAITLAGLRVRLGRDPAAVVDAVERGTARSVLDLLRRPAGDGLTLARALAAAGEWSADRLAGYERDVLRASELRAVDPADMRAARAELSEVQVRLADAERDLLPAAQPRPLGDVQASIQGREVMLIYAWCQLTVTLIVVRAGAKTKCFDLCDHLDAEAEQARIAEAQAVAELLAAGMAPDIEATDAFERAMKIVQGVEPLRARLGDEVAADLTDLLARLRRSSAKYQETGGKKWYAVPSLPAESVGELARELMAFALPPEVRATVAGVARVVVIPSGPLHDLPLDVLAEAGGVPELSGVPVVTSPSASVYAMLRARPAGGGDRSPFVVGDPDLGSAGGPPSAGRSSPTPERDLLTGERAGGLGRLPRARIEAVQVADLYSNHLGTMVTPVVDANATVANVYAGAAGRPLLHFATHAVLGGTADPMGSAVVLSPDAGVGDGGLLRLDMLLTHWRNWLLGCDLVILSSCQSSRGVHLGDSRMALPIGFFHAGARCVLATLWKVDDTATWLLTRRFHENLLGRNDDVRNPGGGHSYGPGEQMSPWHALADARQFVRGITTLQLYDETQQPGVALPGDLKWIDRLNRNGVEHPFADARYWAAFVLIGAVD